MYAECLEQTLTRSGTAGSASVSPYEPGLVDSVYYVIDVSSTPVGNKVLSATHLCFSELHNLMFGCGSLRVFPSDAGGSLSKDDWATH